MPTSLHFSVPTIGNEYRLCVDAMHCAKDQLSIKETTQIATLMKLALALLLQTESLPNDKDNAMTIARIETGLRGIHDRLLRYADPYHADAHLEAIGIRRQGEDARQTADAHEETVQAA